MKKLLVPLLAFILALSFSSEASAQAGTLEEALNIKTAADYIENNIPAIFRDIFIKMYGANNYDLVEKLDENYNYSVQNTEKLGGRTADQYLRAGNNCPDWQIMNRIENGELKCGTRLQMLVQLRSGKWTIDGVERSAPYEFELSKRTTVTTTDDQMELVFKSDNSLIRLDTSTSIKLMAINKAGAESSKTIAQVAYNGEGLLWGRVMSEDGPQFENNKFIAGVRGTSIMMQWDSIYALQSQHETNAVELTKKWTFDKEKISLKSGEYMLGESRQDLLKIGLNISSPCTTRSLCDKLFENEKIRENTKKDIVYLNELETNKIASATPERDIAGPRTNGDSAICNGEYGENHEKKNFWATAKKVDDLCQDTRVVGMFECRVDNDNNMKCDENVTVLDDSFKDIFTLTWRTLTDTKTQNQTKREILWTTSWSYTVSSFGMSNELQSEYLNNTPLNGKNSIDGQVSIGIGCFWNTSNCKNALELKWKTFQIKIFKKE